MGEREDSLLSQKQELLKKRNQLLDIKLQLQKDIHTAQPINFGRKYEKLSEGKALSIAHGLHHRFSDVRFLEKLECHLLCGMKVTHYNSSKLVVQFRTSYLEKILPEVYAISLLEGNNGYSVQKYYLPVSVEIELVVQQWYPLKEDNLKNFFLDIKQQINAFHHRQNQILQLKEWANNKNISLKIFHPLSLMYIIITTRLDDNLKSRKSGSLNLVFSYDSDCYLPTTIDIESSEMEEEDLDAAKEQFSAFKSYSLKEAFEICCIKTERYSLPVNGDIQNENMNKEDKKGTSLSDEDEDITDVSRSAGLEQHDNFRTLSQVNKEKMVLPTVEEGRTNKSKLSAKGKRNRNRDNRSSADENDIAGLGTSSAPEMMEERRTTRTKLSAKGKKDRNRDNRSSADENDIVGLGTSSAPEMMEEGRTSTSKLTAKGKRNRNRDNRSSADENDIAKLSTIEEMMEEGRTTRSKLLAKGKRNRNRDNRSPADENDIVGLGTSSAPEMMEDGRTSTSKLTAKGKRNRNRDNCSSDDDNDIAELSTSSAPQMMEEGRTPRSKLSAKGKRNRNRDNRSSADENDIAKLSTIEEMMEEGRTTRSKLLAKGKRNRNRDNRSSVEENYIAKLSTIIEEVVEEGRTTRSKRSAKGKRNRNRDNRSSDDDNDIAELSTSSASEMMEEGRTPRLKLPAKRNRNRDNRSSVQKDGIVKVNTNYASEKTGEFQLQLETKSTLGSVLQKTKKSKSKYSTNKTNIASEGENNTFQTKKKFNTARKAPKRKNSPDDAQDDRKKKKKNPDTHSTNKETNEVPAPLQTNKITQYFLRRKR